MGKLEITSEGLRMDGVAEFTEVLRANKIMSRDVSACLHKFNVFTTRISSMTSQSVEHSVTEKISYLCPYGSQRFSQ